MRPVLLSALVLSSLAVAASAPSALAGEASAEPYGIWMDHTGRGAVAIRSCNGKLCGEVVWLREADDSSGCGLAVIGDVAKVAEQTWDGGWILDPEFGATFDVEIKPIDEGRLQVTGYLGVKSLSETFVWTRAPETLQPCRTADGRIAGN